jgi:predicted deacetylase
MSWLDPVWRAFDVAPGPVPVFFRDDDAGWADDRLAALLDEFARTGLAVDVAVIPAGLHAGLVRDLTARARADGVHLHQHGFRHVDHQSKGRKHEFGSARTRATQTADIVSGRRLMLGALGDLVEPIFTPPWNRCTSDTAAAAAAVGLQVLSRDLTAEPIASSGLVEVPVTIDWFGHRKGVRWTPVELAGRIAGDIAAGGPVGIMLHHAVTDDDDLAAIVDLLRLVAAHDLADPTTILTVAAGSLVEV